MNLAQRNSLGYVVAASGYPDLGNVTVNIYEPAAAQNKTVAAVAQVKNKNKTVATFIYVQNSQQKIVIVLHVEEGVTRPWFAKSKMKMKATTAIVFPSVPHLLPLFEICYRPERE